MPEPDVAVRCVNCGTSEEEVPLVVLRYAGASQWICSGCLPVLIHRPDQLVGKLAGAENIRPTQHEH
jgi:hypothetical protein